MTNFSIRLRNEDEIAELKILLATGPRELTNIGYTFSNGRFEFFSEDAFRLIHTAFYQLDEETSELASIIASDIVDNKTPGAGPKKPTPISGYSKSTPDNNTNQPKRPVTAKDREVEKIASNLQTAMDRDPNLKRDLERAAQKSGYKFEDAATTAIMAEILAETKDIEIAKKSVSVVLGPLMETALDDIANQIMEYLVALKAQRVKSLSLKKLATTIKNSAIDIDPYQDMKFFIDMISSLPVVKEVNIKGDRVYLELPEQPGEQPEKNEKTDKKEKTDPVKASATKQATDAMNDDPASLFKESADEVNLEVLAFELAETLSDTLSERGWTGENNRTLKLAVDEIVKEYPGVDPELLRSATVDMFNQYHSI